MAITNFLPKTRQMVDKIYSFLQSRPGLYNMVLKLAQRHDNWMGYRKYGLVRDDLLPAENPVVQEALRRLNDKESFDRTFRLRRAVQLYMTHQELPVEEQISQSNVQKWLRNTVLYLIPQLFEKDIPYLWPKIEEVCKEKDEKEMFDSLLPTEASLKRTLNANRSK